MKFDGSKTLWCLLLVEVTLMTGKSIGLNAIFGFYASSILYGLIYNKLSQSILNGMEK